MRFNILSGSVLLALSLFVPAIHIDAQTHKPAITKPEAGRSVTIITEPKAAIWIDEIRRGTTDEAGLLKIDKLAAGARKLRVRAVGFSEKSQTLLPAQRGEIRVQLTETSDEAELAFQQAEALRESGGNKPRAAELYRKAISLRSNFPQAHVGLARLWETSAPDDALEQINEARKDAPAFVEASVVEGRILRTDGDIDGAIKAFKRALRESKNFNPEAHTGLALAYKDQNNNEAAIAEFKIAIAQNSDAEPVLYQLIAETYNQANRRKEAIAAYEKFLQVAPNHNEASAVRSIIEQLKKQTTGDVVELMPQ